MICKYYFCNNCNWNCSKGDVFWGVIELEQVPIETVSPICCSTCGRPYETKCQEPEEQYYCPDCGEILQVIERDENSDVSFNIGGRPYSQPLISDSLAINPEQIPEHREKFPDITVLADGRLQFDNFRQHENYLKATGFNKLTQKGKSVGKTLGGRVVAKINKNGKAEIY